MNNIADLILELQHAAGPDRNLDVQIGIAIGYQRKSTLAVRDRGTKQRKVVWLFPNDGKEVGLPFFTAKLDAAHELAQMLIPGCIGGFTWGGNFCSARINGGPQFTAASPELAVCAAALSAALLQH